MLRIGVSYSVTFIHITGDFATAGLRLTYGGASHAALQISNVAGRVLGCAYSFGCRQALRVCDAIPIFGRILTFVTAQAIEVEQQQPEYSAHSGSAFSRSNSTESFH